MVRIGWNLDTSSIPLEKALATLKASNASGHLIMIDPHSYWLGLGDLDTIRKYANALPDTTLIIRVFHNNQGNWSLYPKAAEYENHWRWVKAQLGADIMKRIVFDDPCNEPNLTGDNIAEATAYVERCVKLVQAAVNAGVKLAIGAWSVGTPHESLFKTVYLPLWRICAKYGQGISYHLYGAAIPELGELVGMGTLLNPVAARNAITNGKWPISHEGWLIARAYRIIQIWEEFKLGTPEHPYPEFYVVEAGIDNVFNAGNSWIKDEFRRRWGIDAFNRDPRGAQAWERYLLEAFKPDGIQDFGRILEFLFRHARKHIFYHPAFKAVCIFALNVQWGYKYAGYAQDGAHKQAGSNYDRPEFDSFRMTYLPAINAEHLEDAPMPETPALIPMRLRSTSTGTNVRNAPNGTILGVLSNVWQDAMVSADYASAAWVQVEVGNLKGYASRQWLEIAERVIVPPTTTEKRYLLDLGHGTIIMVSESEKLKAKRIIQSLDLLLDEAPLVA